MSKRKDDLVEHLVWYHGVDRTMLKRVRWGYKMLVKYHTYLEKDHEQHHIGLELR